MPVEIAAVAYTDLTFDIWNVGNADLLVHSLEFVGINRTAYSLLSPPSVPFTVSALTGRSPVTVRSAPISWWNYEYAKLAIGSNDDDEPVVELTLSGTGESQDK